MIMCIVSDSLRPCGLRSPSLLCSWHSPGNNTGVGCHFLLWGIPLTRDLNCVSFISCIGRWVLYHECHLGSLGFPRDSFCRVDFFFSFLPLYEPYSPICSHVLQFILLLKLSIFDNKTWFLGQSASSPCARWPGRGGQAH